MYNAQQDSSQDARSVRVVRLLTVSAFVVVSGCYRCHRDMQLLTDATAWMAEGSCLVTVLAAAVGPSRCLSSY
jgi:hypothetical protein